MKVFVHNVQKACIPNRLDEELIKEFFKRNGFVIVKDCVQADIILINTCGFVSKKEDESIEAIIKFQKEKKPGTKIIVCGCLPDINKKRLKEVFRGETFGPRSIEKLDRIINAKIKISDVKKYFYRLNHCFPDVEKEQYLKSDSFNINIGIGCLGNCSYCAIKNARGTIKSKPVKEIMREFRCGLRQGHKNFALWGDDTGAYGKDLNTDIIELLKEMLKEKGEYNFHIYRFNPNWLISKFDEFKRLLKSNKISYISVPVQSGNQRILNLMKRGYNIEDFKRCVKTLNIEFPSLKIRTDVIVGFPGETEEEFNDTLKLLDEVRFYNICNFGYDHRPHTETSNMKKQVPSPIKKERAVRLRKKFKNSEEFNRKKMNTQKESFQPGKRFTLRLGYGCNNNCVMCYFYDKLGTIDLSTEEAKENILLAREEGASRLVLTGGEPTIRKDFLTLLHYAIELGIPQIEVQTNGRMFCYEEFVRKIANLQKGNSRVRFLFLVPLYGHNERVHDAITMSPGSFNQTVQGIKNLVKYGQRFIAKTVIMKSNYKHLSDIVKVFTDLNVKYMTITSVCISSDTVKHIKGTVPRFREAVPYLFKALDTFDRKRLKISLSSIPLCVISGYENFLSEKVYDKIILRKNPGEGIKEAKVPKNATRDFQDKTKLKKCKKCRLFSKCGGVWKEYVKMYGEGEFVPVG